jgi:hypothetical protein
LLTIDARIVIASVDTYLHFAEAVNRLDLTQVGSQETLPEMVSDMTESGAGGKAKGMLEGAKEALFGGDEDEGEDREEERKERRAPSRRSSGDSRQRRSSSSSGDSRSRRSSSSSGSGSRGR